MLKLLRLACVCALALQVTNSLNGRFAKFKPIEAYEVRPEILMVPRYSDDGQVCEITIQRFHTLNGAASLSSTIPREQLIQIIDELVPRGDRGPLSPVNLGREYISLYTSPTVTTYAEYENVSIYIYGIASPHACAGDVVATILWKKRKCR